MKGNLVLQKKLDRCIPGQNLEVTLPPMSLVGGHPEDQFTLGWRDPLRCHGNVAKRPYHLETRGNHCLRVFTGEASDTRVSEWCEMDSVHAQ